MTNKRQAPPPSNLHARIEARKSGLSSARRRRVFPRDPAIAARFSWLLKVTGLSTREADRLAGATPGHAHALSRGGIGDPRASTIAAFARMFGVDPGWIISGPTRLADPTPESASAAVVAARARLDEATPEGDAAKRTSAERAA